MSAVKMFEYKSIWPESVAIRSHVVTAQGFGTVLRRERRKTERKRTENELLDNNAASLSQTYRENYFHSRKNFNKRCRTNSEQLYV